MNENFRLFLTRELESLNQKGLKRQMQILDGAQDAHVYINGKEYLNFCSNNYLGLVNHNRLKKAAIEEIEANGVGSGASRLVCGTLKVHQLLEEKIAQFKGAESCLIFNTGYMANLGIISSLFDANDIIFCDKFNHASIIDGIMLSGAKLKRYPHGDMSALEEMLRKETGCRKRVIITDSVFSMDGDMAPLDKIVFLAKKYDCLVMIDEAHALGVLGKNGKGAAEYFGVEKDIDIQMGTLSKAVGSLGAYVCGSKDLISFLINRARSFIYTTALPTSVIAAASEGLDIIQTDSLLRKELWNKTFFLHNNLRKMGFDLLNTQTPIIPILVKDAVKAVKFSQRLFEKGILISAIRPPTVPPHTARLRLTVMATHTQQELEKLLDVLERIGQELCLI